MGDFDRNDSPPKANETKKLVIVLALGIVLVFLVAMQFMKGGAPQAAIGSPVGNGVALPPPILSDEISPQALANMVNDLQSDPTRPLLHAGARGDAALNAPPRNPFRMNGDWRNSLKRVETSDPIAPIRPVPTPVFIPPVATRGADPMPISLKAADYKLSGILNGSTAVINGRVVMVGDTVGKAKVLEIHGKTVRLQSVDAPNGTTLVLSMDSVLGE